MSAGVQLPLVNLRLPKYLPALPIQRQHGLRLLLRIRRGQENSLTHDRR